MEGNWNRRKDLDLFKQMDRGKGTTKATDKSPENNKYYWK